MVKAAPLSKNLRYKILQKMQPVQREAKQPVEYIPTSTVPQALYGNLPVKQEVPSGTISAPDKPQSLWSKIYDKIEDTWILPYYLERRNLWDTKQRIVDKAKSAWTFSLWVWKWLYDTVAQWTRDLWALWVYWISKVLWWDDDVTAWQKVNWWYDDTSFVDYPDKGAKILANAIWWKDPEWNMRNWEIVWNVGALLLPFLWAKNPTSVTKATWVERAVKDLVANPSKYTAAERNAILNSLMNSKETLTQKIWRLTEPTLDKVMPKIWDTANKVLPKIWDTFSDFAQALWRTKLWKYLQNKEVEKAAKILGVDLKEPAFTRTKINPWTDILKWEDYPAFAQKRYNEWMESILWKPANAEPEWLYYMWTKESAPDKWLKLTQENIKNNNILKQAWYSDEEIFALTPSERARVANEIMADEESFAVESLINDDVYPIRTKDVQERLNTSRARANATKKRNMSASERAKRSDAEEWSEDSKKELEEFAEQMRKDAQNLSLDDMYNIWKAIQNW